MKSGKTFLKDYYLKHRALSEKDLDDLVTKSSMSYEQVRDWFSETAKRVEEGKEPFSEEEVEGEDGEEEDEEEDEEEAGAAENPDSEGEMEVKEQGEEATDDDCNEEEEEEEEAELEEEEEEVVEDDDTIQEESEGVSQSQPQAEEQTWADRWELSVQPRQINRLSSESHTWTNYGSPEGQEKCFLWWSIFLVSCFLSCDHDFRTGEKVQHIFLKFYFYFLF